MKRRWLVISIAAAALAVMAVGGAVFAASNGSDDWAEEEEEFTNRVAEILGKEPAEVESAVEQARREQMDEVINEHLDELVEDGRLTQAEADEIKAWVAERPESLSKLTPGFGFGFGLGHMFHARPFGHHRFFKAYPCPEDEAPDETPSEIPATTSF